MPDIAMCMGDHCPRKIECYRYRAIPHARRQSYFTKTPVQPDGSCRYFATLRPGDAVSPPPQRQPPPTALPDARVYITKEPFRGVPTVLDAGDGSDVASRGMTLELANDPSFDLATIEGVTVIDDKKDPR